MARRKFLTLADLSVGMRLHMLYGQFGKRYPVTVLSTKPDKSGNVRVRLEVNVEFDGPGDVVPAGSDLWTPIGDLS